MQASFQAAIKISLLTEPTFRILLARSANRETKTEGSMIND